MPYASVLVVDGREVEVQVLGHRKAPHPDAPSGSGHTMHEMGRIEIVVPSDATDLAGVSIDRGNSIELCHGDDRSACAFILGTAGSPTLLNVFMEPDDYFEWNKGF